MACTAGEDAWIHEVSHSAPSSFLYAGCRRAASFPFVGDKELPLPCVLKVRSQSESEGLNRCRERMTIEQLKQKARLFPTPHEEESSGCETESDSDTLSQSGSSTDLVDLATETEELSLLSCRTKKSVRFADDCGRELYCVKVMSEPSDCPPVIPQAVLKRFRGKDWEDEEQTESSSWVLSFAQPASEYVKFRKNLESQKVCLENIVMKNEVHHITGTIKVANISFEKRVFIRFTSNGWKSYMDRNATFQQSSSRVYDTFTFDIEIPRDTSHDSKLEFCVCYVAGGQEYWDSRDGQNYVLVSEMRHPAPAPVPTATHAPLFGSYRDRDDAYSHNYDNWGGFASWRNLSVEGPYW